MTSSHLPNEAGVKAAVSKLASRLAGLVRRAPMLLAQSRTYAKAGRGSEQRVSLLLPLVALGTVSLLAGLALMAMPLGLAHICLVTGVGLTGSALVAALVSFLEQRPEPKELARFQVLGERLEAGIEKLKDLQWELSDNETRYRDLLDSQNDIITRVDPHGRLTFVNRAFCRTFGVEAGAVLGTRFDLEVLQHEGDARGLQAEAGRRQRFEELVLTAHGPRWFAFEQHAITGEEGRMQETQLLGRDVTEQRRTQAALAEARDQAEAANRAKSRFLAAMSHEIRTPMNGILGMTSLLSDTALTPEQQSYVSAVDHSAKNLLTIIDEILDLSKIEAGKLEIHPAPFPLDECLQSVIELLGPRAREKRLDIAWRLDPDLPRMVIGDETRLRQILLNLIGNAIKFTDRGGVAMRVRRVSHPAGHAGSAQPGSFMIEIEIADTGAGIAPDLVGSLFAEFGQADDVVRRKRSGTGLGLAISRQLARAMDGDIEFQSVLGDGSTFRARVTLQTADETPAMQRPSGARGARRVLIVSSRVHQRTIMCEILAALAIGSEVADPSSVLETIVEAGLRKVWYDTIVADAELGVDAIARLAGEIGGRSGSRPRTILVVDQPGGGRLDAFRAAGADAYLVRPVRPASLVAQLDGDGVPPARLSEPVTAAEPGTRALPPRARNILLVEDNDINALLARRMSERAGCSVHHSASGPAAIAHCESLLADSAATIDLVLMDIHMPEMDGFETARRVKRLFAARGRNAPPIVALTANAFAEDRKRCLEAGLDDYLAKPFDRSELEALLEKWCAPRPTSRDGLIGEAAA